MPDGVQSIAPASASPTHRPCPAPPAEERDDPRAAPSRGAAAELIAAHGERVSRVVHRLLGWPDDVEDVVQDVIVAALAAADRFRGDADVATWLTAIAIRKCRTHQRRRRLRQRVLGWLRLGGSRVGGQSGRASEQDERAAAMRRAMQRLPARDREVLVLRYLEDLPVATMATLLGIRGNAVEVRLTRARQRLRELLNVCDEREPRP